MKRLQDEWDLVMNELLGFPRVATIFIQRKLRAKGVELTDSQLAKVEEGLTDLQTDSILLRLDESQIPEFDSKTGEEIAEILSVDFSNAGTEIDKLTDLINEVLGEGFPELLEQLSETILTQLMADAAAMLRRRKRVLRRFESRLKRTWHYPLALLETFLVICYESGEDFNEEFCSSDLKQGEYAFKVLTALHARACQIASEILVLLKSGFADGAHARWRSLHEISVVSYLIGSGGDDIAERYLCHHVVESRRAAREYQEHCEALSYDPISDDEMNEIETAYQELLARFGTDYKEPYGWASPLFANSKNRRRGIKDLERLAGLEHLRPFYRMASHNVHAGPKAMFFRLGLYQNPDILLAGPSNVGLADPGQATAISLGQVTSNLLLSREPNIDRLVTCQIIMKLTQEIEEQFVTTQESILNDGIHPWRERWRSWRCSFAVGRRQ